MNDAMNCEGSFEERWIALQGELSLLQDEDAVYGFLIRQGDVLAPFPEELKIDAFLLRGCQYRIWLHLVLEDGRVRIDADSDSRMIRGLIALWIRLFSGLTPEDALAVDGSCLHRSVLGRLLLPSLTNALENMGARIRLGVLRLKQAARKRGGTPRSLSLAISDGLQTGNARDSGSVPECGAGQES